jgi:hypothetical protein
VASRLVQIPGFQASDGGRSDVVEQMIEANGVELSTESFGDPADPPILLVMGQWRVDLDNTG